VVRDSRAGIDRNQTRHSRDLDLLHADEFRQPLSQIRPLLDAEFEHLLQIGPQLVQARRLGVRARAAQPLLRSHALV
jgi:hypothetical protein